MRKTRLSHWLAACLIAACGRLEAQEPRSDRPTLGFIEVHDTAKTELPAPRLAAPCIEQRISLGEALGRAGFANPTIALANEGVAAGESLRQQARALLLPNLVAGLNVRLHEGNLQTATGRITRNSLDSLYVGAGAEVRGGGTAGTPGVRLVAHLGDALLEPRLAELRLAGIHSDAQAISRRVLADVMTRYLALAAANARLAAVRETLAELREVTRITQSYAKAGQGRTGDAERAESELLLVQAEEQRLVGEQAAAAAALARLLDFDPSILLVAADEGPPSLEWIDPSIDLDALIPQAERLRPELASRSAAIAFGQTRIRQERLRPFLPVLSVGYSAGTFGGGGTATPSPFSSFGSREDFDAYAVWTLRGLGFGNRAEVLRAQAQTRVAEAQFAQTLTAIRSETAAGLANARYRRQEIQLIRLRLAHAAEAYEQDLQRTRNLQGRPIEVLNSVNLLNAARQDLISAMAGYSQAQIDLLFATGRDVTPGSCAVAP
jgi:outer membrane protein TolC